MLFVRQSMSGEEMDRLMTVYRESNEENVDYFFSRD